MAQEFNRSDDSPVEKLVDLDSFLVKASKLGYQEEKAAASATSKKFTHPLRKCEAHLVLLQGSWTLFRGSKELRSIARARAEH